MAPARRQGNFRRLKRIFDRLHSPKGCPWDKEQTHRSILPGLREETRELIQAVESDDPAHMCEELGDVLLHVMFHAKLAQKAGWFDIEDVIAGLNAKLIRRHPHVFGKEKVSSSKQVMRNWQKIKDQEKAGRRTLRRKRS
jgi:tetrapyrrole methylase family protein / MazG family protein